MNRAAALGVKQKLLPALLALVDIRSEGLKVHPLVAPKPDGGVRRLHDRVCLLGSPVAAALVMQPLRQSRTTEADDLARVGPAAEKVQDCYRYRRANGRNPVGAQDFRYRIKAMHAGAALFDKGGANLDCSPKG
jgi:hypothetical protein